MVAGDMNLLASPPAAKHRPTAVRKGRRTREAHRESRANAAHCGRMESR